MGHGEDNGKEQCGTLQEFVVYIYIYEVFFLTIGYAPGSGSGIGQAETCDDTANRRPP